MRRTFSNSLGKSLSDSTTSERKNTKARRARQRVITIKTRLSASQCEKFLVNFFFLFCTAQHFRTRRTKWCRSKKNLTYFEISTLQRARATLRNFLKLSAKMRTGRIYTCFKFQPNRTSLTFAVFENFLIYASLRAARMQKLQNLQLFRCAQVLRTIWNQF